MKVCVKCNKENDDNNVFCGFCGQKINDKQKKKSKLIKFLWFALVFVLVFWSLKSCSESAEETAQRELTLALVKEKVKISLDVQDIYEYKRKIVVFIKNESDKTFSGTIYINIKNSIGESLHTDYIYPEKVSPSGQTYAIFFVPLCDGYRLAYDVSGAKLDTPEVTK